MILSLFTNKYSHLFEFKSPKQNQSEKYFAQDQQLDEFREYECNFSRRSPIYESYYMDRSIEDLHFSTKQKQRSLSEGREKNVDNNTRNIVSNMIATWHSESRTTSPATSPRHGDDNDNTFLKQHDEKPPEALFAWK